ncbi:hypothetical protein B1729_04250 [Microbacterium sp. B35-04]|nr:hypothetical protein B1729_04250 [Microbacterium sp. B35-04]KAF2417343.1 hypothetical protein B2K11_12690 [Microbacterium sp. B35-30]
MPQPTGIDGREASLAEVRHESTSAPATMRNALLPAPTEDPMDYGFLSHALLWLIGAMAAVGALLTALAFWSLGRQGYRKD